MKTLLLTMSLIITMMVNGVVEAETTLRGPPRACPYVVWGSCNDGMVGWPLAQRKLRRFYGCYKPTLKRSSLELQKCRLALPGIS